MKRYSYQDETLSASCSVDTQPQPHQFKMHAHSGAEVYCFLGGKGIFHVEGTEYVLECGDVMVFGPSESHYIELDTSVPYERATVHLQPIMFERIDPSGELLRPFWDRKAGKNNLYKYHQFMDGNSRRYWQVILSETGNGHMNVISGLVGLLHEIYNIYTNGEQEGTERDTVEYQIIRYINKNLTRQITLDEICGKFYISKPQLCRRFKKAMGTTVHQYITVKRLVEARNKLRAGIPPEQVGNALGFGDYSSFYRAYRNHYGCSPGQVE